MIAGLRDTLNELPDDRAVQTEFRKGIEHQYRKSKQWVSDYCLVASFEIPLVQNSGQVPATMSVLLLLIRLELEEFRRCLEAGDIHTAMDTADAKRLVEGKPAERAVSTPGTQLSAEVSPQLKQAVRLAAEDRKTSMSKVVAWCVQNALHRLPSQLPS